MTFHTYFLNILSALHWNSIVIFIWIIVASIDMPKCRKFLIIILVIMMVFHNLITLMLTYITHILVSISYAQSRNVSFDPLIVRETHSLQILGRRKKGTVWSKNVVKHRFTFLYTLEIELYGKEKSWQSVSVLLCRMQLLLYQATFPLNSKLLSPESPKTFCLKC